MKLQARCRGRHAVALWDWAGARCLASASPVLKMAQVESASSLVPCVFYSVLLPLSVSSLCLLPVLSCVIKFCIVSMLICAGDLYVWVCALRIVSVDKIQHFINTRFVWVLLFFIFASNNFCKLQVVWAVLRETFCVCVCEKEIRE